MSSAFVKEGEYQKLSDVGSSISALSYKLRWENGTKHQTPASQSISISD